MLPFAAAVRFVEQEYPKRTSRNPLVEIMSSGVALLTLLYTIVFRQPFVRAAPVEVSFTPPPPPSARLRTIVQLTNLASS